MDQPVARAILRSGQWLKADGRVTLGYDARFLRRKRLVAEDGSSFLVDLTETTSLDQGDAFDGHAVRGGGSGDGVEHQHGVGRG